VTNGELGATGQKIYDFIRESHATTGLVPTVREIREAIGVSSIGTVGYWLDKLEASNLIRRDAGKNRSIQLRGESPTVPVPLVGEIRAGSPILAEERVDGNFVLPRQLVGEGTLFMLRVRGDSMLDAQIAENDYVVVREQRDAQNGDIVAALVPGAEDGATIKRFSRSGDRVRLLPANKSYKPIPFGPDGRILGKVVTVLRRV
jgi:repressor LexA